MDLQKDLPLMDMQKVIVHYIPKHKKNDFNLQVRYSKKVTEPTPGLKTFFKKKITEALMSEKAFKICYDSTSTSPLPAIVKSYLEGVNLDFIDISQKITDRLYKVQTGINPSGIVLVISASVAKTAILFILKLEPDSGAQMKFNEEGSIDIHEVEDLMLTNRTKLFKVALLYHSETKAEKFDGVLMDFQINIQAKKRIESFFLDSFLGCAPYQDPRSITKTFYELSRNYIDAVEDPVLRTTYINHLNSFVQSNNNVISPRTFAEEYLQTPEEMQSYQDHLTLNRFPFEAFQKNTQYIEPKLKKITIEFDNDISIIAKQGDIGNKVKLKEITEGDDKGKHMAKIVARIKKVN